MGLCKFPQFTTSLNTGVHTRACNNVKKKLLDRGGLETGFSRNCVYSRARLKGGRDVRTGTVVWASPPVRLVVLTGGQMGWALFAIWRLLFEKVDVSFGYCIEKNIGDSILKTARIHKHTLAVLTEFNWTPSP
jgi:hypothetical protein